MRLQFGGGYDFPWARSTHKSLCHCCYARTSRAYSDIHVLILHIVHVHPYLQLIYILISKNHGLALLGDPTEQDQLREDDAHAMELLEDYFAGVSCKQLRHACGYQSPKHHMFRLFTSFGMIWIWTRTHDPRPKQQKEHHGLLRLQCCPGDLNDIWQHLLTLTS